MNRTDLGKNGNSESGKPKSDSEPLGRPGPIIIYRDPADLRVHPLKRKLLTTDHRPLTTDHGPQAADEAGWNAFVDGMSGAGVDGVPAIYVTHEGLVMDGERRWRAARQLQWPLIGCIEREEWEAPAIMIESLLGQRSLTKGAKVYLSLALLPDYVKSAESRRLRNLKTGTKTLEKPLNVPNPTQLASGKGLAELCGRLGCSDELIRQAIQIRKFFELPTLAEHQFTFQDGSQKTLREYWEPIILDPVHPKGLGEVLKGIGYFVDPDGKPLEYVPPARNSYLAYFQKACQHFGNNWKFWSELTGTEREQAEAILEQTVGAVPSDALPVLARQVREEKKRRAKAARRGNAEKGEGKV